jgi:hypothetical protein
MDYFATCNLGVRSSAYRAVGGFRQMRSGGDADLCWRIQQAGLGHMGVDRRVLMEWQPRTSLWELVEQFYRYGKCTADREVMWPEQTPRKRLDWQLIRSTHRGTEVIRVAHRLGLWHGRLSQSARRRD